MANSIASSIAKCCIDKYEGFPKRFKPSPNQWTILAGIVMERREEKREEVGEYPVDTNKKQLDISNLSLKCVSLATGMKCLGRSHRLPTGEIINDSHAEVLSRRAFQKYIYSELKACMENKDSIFQYNKKTGKFRLLNSSAIKFHLYVSQAPCGDASTVSLSELQTEEEKRINENKKRIFNEKQQSSNKHIKLEDENLLLRGRLNYDKLGVLRTKPGRIDADPTLSMSCSDKILKWTYLGLTGALLMRLLEKPIYLASVTVEEMYDETSLRRALITRCGEVKELPLPYKKTIPHLWKSGPPYFPYTKRQIEMLEKKREEEEEEKEKKEKEKEKEKEGITATNNNNNAVITANDNNNDNNDNDNNNNNENKLNKKKKKKKNRIKADDKAIYWSSPMSQPEAIIHGRKQGASPKQGQYSKKTWSDLCRYHMLKRFLQTMQQFQQFQQLQVSNNTFTTTNTFATTTSTIMTSSEQNLDKDHNQDQVQDQDLSGKTYEAIKKSMAPRYREARNYLFYGHPYEYDDDDENGDNDNNGSNDNDSNGNDSNDNGNDSNGNGNDSNDNDSNDNGNDSNGNDSHGNPTKDSTLSSTSVPLPGSLRKSGVLKGWTRKPKGEQSFKI